MVFLLRNTRRLLPAGLALTPSMAGACASCRPQVFEALRTDPELPTLLFQLGTVPALVAAFAAFSLWLPSRRPRRESKGG